MNVMVDLETLDTEPTAMIVSLGAVKFDENGLYEEFYAVVDSVSCIEFERTMSIDTLRWWMNQTPKAQEALIKSFSGDPTQAGPLDFVLNEFVLFMRRDQYAKTLWGNGADFDNVILASSMKACDCFDPTMFRGNRCYRTLRNLYPQIKQERQGEHHNALDDAITQAKHASAILRHISSFPPEKGSGNGTDGGS